jgi:hypothetical protein
VAGNTHVDEDAMTSGWTASPQGKGRILAGASARQISGPTRPASRLIACVVAAALLALLFAGTSRHLNGGQLVPPLDDTYIHFQYADRLAAGAPFEYSPGEGYTSGATSLLWPVLLAPGAVLGLFDTGLYVYALVLSALLFAGCLYFTWRMLARLAPAPTAAIGTAMLAGSGPLLWGVFSGMEVALFACALAAVIDYATRRAPESATGPVWPGWLWGAVLAATRPEGALMVGLIGVWRMIEARRRDGSPSGARFGGALPWLLASLPGLVQPLLNLAHTGRLSPATLLAKHNARFTHPADVPWLEQFVGGSIGGAYGEVFCGPLFPFALLAFAIGIGWLIAGDRRNDAGGLGAIVLVLWLAVLLLLAALMPLDWHHHRHLMPTLVLFVPVVALGADQIDRWLQRATGWRPRHVMLTVLAVAWVIMLPGWAHTFAVNARDIVNQQVWCGRWVAEHTGDDVTVALNDAGAIAYLGGRRILDLEGVVSPRALPWALSGQGSVLSLIRRERPDWIVCFPQWFPGLYRAGAFEVLQHVRLDRHTISGAADMVIARPRAAVFMSGERAPDLAAGARVVDTIDVTDLVSEEEHAYRFDDAQPDAARANRIVHALTADDSPLIDGARRHHRYEAFRLQARAGGRCTLIARLAAAASPTTVEVTIGGDAAGEWTFPAVPDDRWLEARFDLPRSAAGAAIDIELRAAGATPGTRGGWSVARWWLVESGRR